MSEKRVKKEKTDADITVRQWRNILKKDFPEFTGNLEAGAQILFRIANGAKEAEDYYRSHGAKKFNRSQLYLIPPELAEEAGIPEVAAINRQDGQPLIVVSISFLNKYSDYPLEKITEFKKKDGRVLFKGTILQYMEDAGREEAAHNVASSYKKDLGGKYDAEKATSSEPGEYDAQKIEQMGLIIRITLAKKNNYPEETIDVLRNRLKTAKEFLKKSVQ